ncbi:MAG: BatA domain-containing protein [Cyclobacteriaceae bacterium]
MNYFYWFLFFLTIPIIVHLFNFRRAKKLFFTNVKFIRKVSTETKSKTRLKHFLVLSARLLAFLSLVATFIFSLTNFKSNELSNVDSMGLFYLDNSSSAVGNSIGDERTLIADLVSSKKANTGFLLTNNFSSFSNNERTKTEILQRVEELGVSYTSRSISDVLNRVDTQGDTYLISDFQDASLDQLGSIREDSANNYYLLYQENVLLKNAFVDSVWLVRDLDDYSNMLLNCRIGHTENFLEGSIVVKLLNEDGSQISSVVKGLDRNLDIEFSLPQTLSTKSYRVQISGDEIEFDNDFYLTVNQSKIPSILVLSQSPNRYLSSIFGNGDLFHLNLSEGEIDYDLLAKADMVVVNDYFQLPVGLISQNLAEVSFLIIPSDSIDHENYEEELGMTFSRLENSKALEITVPKGNELLQGIYKKIDEGASFPSAKSKYQISSTHEPILQLRNGNTFLGKNAESPLYFLNSPLKDGYTDFPNHSIFLPVMYRIAEESLDADLALFTYPNDFLEISNLSADQPPKIVSEGVEIIPEFSLGNLTGLLRVPNDLSPGFYHVLQGTDTVKSFGLNLSKNESLFAGPSLDEVDDFFANSSHVTVISMSDQQNSGLLDLGDDNGLWKYALILALIFIMLETLFHRYLK